MLQLLMAVRLVKYAACILGVLRLLWSNSMHKVEYLCAIHVYLCYGASLGSWLESLQQWLGMDDFIASLENIRWRIIKYQEVR